MEKIRSLVRPILTLSGWGTFLYLVIVENGDIRLAFVGMLAGLVGYWFGERKK